jgi:hypothetical protein
MVNLSEEMVKAMISIIDMSAKSGSFVGPNLSVVGQVRSELENALKQKPEAPDDPYDTKGLDDE